MNNDAVKKYCILLRGLFQTINFHQGKFLKSYKEMLNEYAFLNLKCTYEDLVSRFGTPQEVFIDYLNEQNPDAILKTIRKNNGKKF